MATYSNGPVGNEINFIQRKNQIASNRKKFSAGFRYPLGEGPMTATRASKMIANIRTPNKFNIGKMSPAVKATVPRKRKGINIDMDKIREGADSAMPYISNAVNALRKPPSAPVPNLVRSVSLVSPSLAQERAEIDRQVRGLNKATDILDANTGAAVRTANAITGMRAKGQSFANEAKIKADVQNQSAQINANVDAVNAGKMDRYDENQVASQIAQQRVQSENLANFADKRIAEQAREDAIGLEKDRFSILSKMYSSGVLNRLINTVLKRPGNTEITDEDAEKTLGLKRAMGGFIGGGEEDPKTKTFTSQAQVDAANAHAKSFAMRRGLVSGQNTYVAKKPGDPVPRYIDTQTGKDYVPTPTKPKAFSVPNWVTLNDIQTADGIAWYEDRDTGRLVDIDLSVLNQPKFRKTKSDIEKDLTGRRRTGGYIGGTIGGSTRKLKKVY